MRFLFYYLQDFPEHFLDAEFVALVDWLFLAERDLLDVAFALLEAFAVVFEDALFFALRDEVALVFEFNLLLVLEEHAFVVDFDLLLVILDEQALALELNLLLAFVEHAFVLDEVLHSLLYNS